MHSLHGPLRILFVETSPKISGAEVCLLTLLEKLPASTVHPVVACPDRSEMMEATRARGVTTEPLELAFLRRHDPLHVARFGLDLLQAVLHCAALARRHEVDLIHAFLPAAFKIAGPAAVLARVPAVGTLHDALVPGVLSDLQARMIVAIMNRCFAHIIAVSDAVRDIAVARGLSAAKTSTVYNGVGTTSRFRLTSTPSHVRRLLGLGDCPIICCLGRLTPWKGQLQLLEAFAKIAHEVPNARCLIVGDTFDPRDGWYKEELIRCASKSDLAGRVIFLGQRSDAADLIVTSDVVVVPSQLPDPLPTVILEAMFLGKPVVATNLGGAQELIVDEATGLLVSSDITQLGMALLRFLTDRHLASSFGERAARRARELFDIGHYVSRTTDIYSAVARQGRVHC